MYSHYPRQLPRRLEALTPRPKSRLPIEPWLLISFFLPLSWRPVSLPSFSFSSPRLPLLSFLSSRSWLSLTFFRAARSLLRELFLGFPSSRPQPTSPDLAIGIHS